MIVSIIGLLQTIHQLLIHPSIEKRNFDRGYGVKS